MEWVVPKKLPPLKSVSALQVCPCESVYALPPACTLMGNVAADAGWESAIPIRAMHIRAVLTSKLRKFILFEPQSRQRLRVVGNSDRLAERLGLVQAIGLDVEAAVACAGTNRGLDIGPGTWRQRVKSKGAD